MSQHHAVYCQIREGYNVCLRYARYAQQEVRNISNKRLSWSSPPRFPPQTALPNASLVDTCPRAILVPNPVLLLICLDDALRLGHQIGPHAPTSQYNALLRQNLFSASPSLSPHRFSLVDILSVSRLALAAAVETECAAGARAVELLALSGCGEGRGGLRGGYLRAMRERRCVLPC